MIKKQLCSIVLLSAIGATATAEDSRLSDKLYVGAGFGTVSSDFSVGNVDSELALNGLTANTGEDDSDQGHKFFAGYRFHQHFGVELAYIDLGEMSADTQISFPFEADIDTLHETSGINLSLVGSMEAADKLHLSARLGVFSWESDTEVSANFPAGSSREKVSEDSTDISFGLSATYAVSEQLSLRADWDRLPTEDAGDNEFDLFSINLLMNF